MLQTIFRKGIAVSMMLGLAGFVFHPFWALAKGVFAVAILALILAFIFGKMDSNKM